MTCAEVLLPLPLSGTFTYSVPPAMADKVLPGHRVIVPFGRKKFYTGIVAGLTPVAPEGVEVKPISQALDSAPIVRHPQIKFWEWLAGYYLCSPGEVYKAALPAGLKIESETHVELSPDFEENPAEPLSEREVMILQYLDHAEKSVTLADLDKATGFRNIAALTARLVEKGAVMVSEKLVERYRSRRETYVEPAIPRGDSEALHAAFNTVSSAPKQEKALLTLIELSGFMRAGAPLRDVTKKELMERAGVSAAIVAALEKRSILRQVSRTVSRFDAVGSASGKIPVLSEAQAAALDSIHKSWLGKEITLLRGVTSSGKTEIYIHLIDYVLRQGRQALYLVPEIALTTQLTRRLQKVFGDKVLIYHSKFSDNERVDLWRRMLSDNSPRVVIGARSSVFLPFANLGLVIVDEEHESSFKQQDPAPRYNGRDAAIVLAGMHGAKTLLGSATPSIDTYYKALTGRYGLVELTERYDGVNLPRMELVDMTEARKKQAVSGTFSFRLRKLVKEAVDNNRQAILFLNRRGFAPLARCKMCGYVPRCENCDVTLTYHRRIDRLVCHYCGTPYELPRSCPACHEPAIEVLGYGTERVEDEVDFLFPDARILRMDLDTTRNKDGYETIIENFSQRKADILVGTQMVTKGLDFDGVSVVGVVNADAIVNIPDFRSAERAFCMLEQVAGRAGRRGDTPGTVAVQTYTPSHPVFPFLVNHDYCGFYGHEIEERRAFGYPPFTRLIYIYLKHREVNELTAIAVRYAARLRELFGTRVQGPDAPSVARVQNLHIRRIMLKIETNASMTKVKEILHSLKEEMWNAGAIKGAIIYYDVDPM